MQADILAKKGAEEHSVCDVRIHLAEARKNLTMLVQSMMVDIWTSEIKFRFPDEPEKAISCEDAQDHEQMQTFFMTSLPTTSGTPSKNASMPKRTWMTFSAT